MKIPAVILLLALAAPAAAQMKSWTDEDGVTHYGNAPAKPKEMAAPEPVKIDCPFVLPEGARRGDEAGFKLAVNAFLADLKDCHVKIESHFLLENARLETAAIGRSGSTLNAIALKQRLNTLEKVKTVAPLKESLLGIERLVKSRNNGSLPDWVKDNRDWRYLDKVLSP